MKSRDFYGQLFNLPNFAVCRTIHGTIPSDSNVSSIFLALKLLLKLLKIQFVSTIDQNKSTTCIVVNTQYEICCACALLICQTHFQISNVVAVNNCQIVCLVI